jgi:Trypsin
MRNSSPVYASTLKFFATASLALGVGAGCASGDGASLGDDLQATQSAVINGAVSTADDDAVILLAHYDPKTGEFGSCTGTMITENLVLTARHCVSKTDEGALCTPLGKPINGGKVYSDHPADTLYVFTGVAAPKFGSGDVKAAGRGVKVFTSGADTLCNSDIALVQLAKPIVGARLKQLRVDAPALLDEKIRSVGFGLTEKGRSPTNRLERRGVKVIQVGAGKGNPGGASSQEFEVGESICSGDSGGPAIAEASEAILGVVSRGGNGTGGDQANRAANCVGDAARNIYTALPPFRDLILSAAQEAGGEIWVEGGADPRLAVFGASCTDGAECRSGLCVPNGKGTSICSKACEADECGDGLACRKVIQAQAGSETICQAPLPAVAAAATPGGGGICSVGVATAPSSTGAVALLAALCVVLAARRKRA